MGKRVVKIFRLDEKEPRIVEQNAHHNLRDLPWTSDMINNLVANEGYELEKIWPWNRISSGSLPGQQSESDIFDSGVSIGICLVKEMKDGVEL